MKVSKSNVKHFPGKRGMVYYLWYTILFTCFCAAVFYPFWSSGTGLIYAEDGLWQHYHALIYYGKWLRAIVCSIIIDHRFQVPLWDHAIGYGADILTTFSYYVIGDPFAFLSAFVPARFTEVLYDCLVILRLYAAGAAFSAFCLYHKKRRVPVLAGALCYVFCSYAIYGGLKHPFFLNPMVFFPLMLLGADRVLEKKKYGLFIFMVFVSVVSNFYFFYMIVLGCMIYVLIRFFTFPHERPLCELGLCISRFMILGLIGLLMGMGVFLPTVRMFLGTYRYAAGTDWMLLYPSRYYTRFIGSFVFGKGTGYWTLLGYAWPCVPALILLFVWDFPVFRGHLFFGGKEGLCVRRMLRLAFLLLTGMLFLPVCGKIFNGFSYVSNRWVWIYSALVSYILTYIWDRLEPYIRIRQGYHAAVSFVLVLMCLHLTWNSFNRYDSKRGNDLSIFLPFGQAYRRLISEKAPQMQERMKAVPDDLWRFEKSRYTTTNEAVIFGYRGLQAYWSLTAGSVSSYLVDTRLNPYGTFSYSGADSRTILDELASVRYYISYDGYTPYGYKKIADGPGNEDGYGIYENSCALSSAYYYDTCIMQEKWEAMDPVEKQACLMQAVVLEKAADSLPDTILVEDVSKTDTRSKKVPCHLRAGENARITGEDSFAIEKKNGQVELEFEGRENCETYLLIRNLRVKTSRTRLNVYAAGKRKAKGYYIAPEDRYYYGQKDILLNLGYSKEAQTHAVLSVGNKCRCTFDEIAIICMPMDSYENDVKALSSQNIQVQTGVNQIHAKADFSRPGILCFSVPFSRGWKAEVDGKPVPLLRANVMYMAIGIDKGEHKVILHYCTPGLKTGLLLSLCGWILLLALFLLLQKRRNCQKRFNSKK